MEGRYGPSQGGHSFKKLVCEGRRVSEGGTQKSREDYLFFETWARPCVMEKELVEMEKLKTKREIKMVDNVTWGEGAIVS